MPSTAEDFEHDLATIRHLKEIREAERRPSGAKYGRETQGVGS